MDYIQYTSRNPHSTVTGGVQAIIFSHLDYCFLPGLLSSTFAPLFLISS